MTPDALQPPGTHRIARWAVCAASNAAQAIWRPSPEACGHGLTRPQACRTAQAIQYEQLAKTSRTGVASSVLLAYTGDTLKYGRELPPGERRGAREARTLVNRPDHQRAIARKGAPAMALTLTADQLKDIALTTGGGRYSKEAWKGYLVKRAEEIDAADEPIAFTKNEDDFKNVRKEHVIHMFRLILKDDPELAARIEVGLSKEHGVIIRGTAKAVEATPDEGEGDDNGDEGAGEDEGTTEGEGTTRRRRRQQAA